MFDSLMTWLLKTSEKWLIRFSALARKEKHHELWQTSTGFGRPSKLMVPGTDVGTTSRAYIFLNSDWFCTRNKCKLLLRTVGCLLSWCQISRDMPSCFESFTCHDFSISKKTHTHTHTTTSSESLTIMPEPTPRPLKKIRIQDSPFVLSNTLTICQKEWHLAPRTWAPGFAKWEDHAATGGHGSRGNPYRDHRFSSFCPLPIGLFGGYHFWTHSHVIIKKRNVLHGDVM